MRLVATIVVLLLAACSSAAVTYNVDELAGHYRGNLAIDSWNELDLVRDESCVWWLCSLFGGFNKIAIHGRWTIESGQVVITPDPGPSGDGIGAIRLTLRRLEGQIYLVPDYNVEWFDAHGPDQELCLCKDAASVQGPPYGWSANEPLHPTPEAAQRR